jgi:hypothetical protein
MEFKEWQKTKEAKEYCGRHTHLNDEFQSYRRMDCEECIWKAAKARKW